jgi:hypothetical protein
MYVKESDILLAEDLNLALEVTNSYVDPSCGNSKIYQTTEGLFVSQDVESKHFPAVERHQNLIDKFILSGEDMLRYTTYQVYRHFVHQACLNQKMILRTFKNIQDKFVKIEDYDGSKLTLYAKNGAIWIPKCASILNVNVYVGFIENRNCFSGVMVNFTNREKLYKGYLTDDFIIRSEVILDTCDDKEFQLGEIMIKKRIKALKLGKQQHHTW